MNNTAVSTQKNTRFFYNFGLAFRMARRELRTGLRGFLVFLICLIIGVGSIAAVQSLSQGLTESLEHDSKYILGGDIALRTIYEPAPQEHVNWLRGEIGPTSIVTETRAMARDETGDHVTLTEVKAVDAYYPLYGEMRFVDGNGETIETELQELILPRTREEIDAGDRGWGAVVEPQLMEKLDLKIGDNIYVGNQVFDIRGIIDHEPDRLGAVRFTLAPRVMISLHAFTLTGLAQTGSQVYYDHKVNIHFPHHIYGDLAGVQNAINAKFPDATWTGRNYMNASPMAERFISRLSLYLTLIGLTALLVGGVGIANAVRSHLDTRLPTMATFKCLGATGKLVFWTYLIQIMILGILGVVLGLAFGAAVPLAAGHILTSKLSLTNQIGIYPEALGLAAAFGVLTVLAFSLWPIGRACRIAAADLFRDLIAPNLSRPTPTIIFAVVCVVELLALTIIMSAENQNLAINFLVTAFGSVILFIAIAWLIKFITKRMKPSRNASLRLALSNLYRPGNVTNSIILSLGLGLTVLVLIALIQYNFTANINETVEAEAPSFYFIDIQNTQIDTFKSIINNVKTADNIQITPIIRGRIDTVNDVPAKDAIVNTDHAWVIKNDRGFTESAEQPSHSEITEGAWWDADYNGPPIISISTDVAEAFDIGVGDHLTINILGFGVKAEVANVRDVDWRSFNMNFAITFAPGSLGGAPFTYLATAEIGAKDEIGLQQELAKALPNVTSIRIKETLAVANRLLENIGLAVKLSASVALFAGVLVLAGSVAAGRMRRIYDAVILKVLGVTRRRILGVFLLEFAILGLFTALTAAVLGTGIAWLVQKYVIQLPWYFDLKTVCLTVLIAVLVTVGMGYLGTWRALQAKAAPLLRNQ